MADIRSLEERQRDLIGSERGARLVGVEVLEMHVREESRLRRRIEELRDAVLYLAGYDIAGWEGHMRPDEVLAKAGVRTYPHQQEDE